MAISAIATSLSEAGNWQERRDYPWGNANPRHGRQGVSDESARSWPHALSRGCGIAAGFAHEHMAILPIIAPKRFGGAIERGTGDDSAWGKHTMLI